MAWGHGLITIASDGTILDAWYPEVFLGDAPKSDLQWFSPRELDSMVGQDEVRGVRTEVTRTEIDLTLPVANTQDAYLRLHLLSHLVVEPNTINLEGLIPNLPIVAFTNRGVMRLEDFEAKTITLRNEGVVAHSIDKFPRLIDYVVPKKVRIADGNRVRLGAHLAPGTTVMHEGFVNFNAGTLGTSMVEGRISQGVWSAMAATSVAGHRSWAPSSVVGSTKSQLARELYLVPIPELEFQSETIQLLRPAFMSQPEPRSH